MIVGEMNPKKEILMQPQNIIESFEVDCADELLIQKPTAVSFNTSGCACFRGKESYVVLDFGKELCGSIRFITRSVPTKQQNYVLH